VNTAKTLGAALLLAAVGAGGYYWGSRTPMAPQAQAEAAASVLAGAASTPAAPRKLLYYRNPMGLPDTSATPKKDQMGMDYIAVYEGEDDSEPSAAGSVSINTEKVQKLGVRTEAASLQPLGRTLRLAGRVEPDERRVFMVAPKFEGYVERLHVNATGQAVAKGQALFEVYSPDMVSAQREAVIALQGLKDMQGAGAEAQAGMQQLADASLARLRNWDLSAEQLDALVKTGKVHRSLAFASPVSGTVTEKKARAGHAFHARRGAVPGHRPERRVGAGRRARAGPGAGEDRRQSQRAPERLSGAGLHRHRDPGLPHAERRHAHGAGAH
jgi:hypothetical protein